jgi:hypothetical protein
MPIDKIDVIFCSLSVNRIAYCLNAWGGYLNDEQIGRIDALFKRAKRYGFTRFYYDYSLGESWNVLILKIVKVFVKTNTVCIIFFHRPKIPTTDFVLEVITLYCQDANLNFIRSLSYLGVYINLCSLFDNV